MKKSKSVQPGKVPRRNNRAEKKATPVVISQFDKLEEARFRSYEAS